jgi:tetratricopeptide (TPR) repeat protein
VREVQDVLCASGDLHVFALDIHSVAGRKVHPCAPARKIVDEVDAPGGVDRQPDVGAPELFRCWSRREKRDVEFFELAAIAVDAAPRNRLDSSDARDFDPRTPPVSSPSRGRLRMRAREERGRRQRPERERTPRDHAPILLASRTAARSGSYADLATPLSFEATVTPMLDPKSLSEDELLDQARDALKQKRYEPARDLFAEYCARMAARNVPVQPGIVASYALARGYAREMKAALDMCRKALAADRGNPHIHACLAELYIRSGARRQAVEAIRRGLAASPEYPVLLRLQEEIGVRQRTPIGFLPRGNPVNVAIGRRLRRLKRGGRVRPA